MAIDCTQLLDEAAIPYNRSQFLLLSEAAQIQVTDEALSGMMKFITDKYNSLDFGEIEKSAGDFRKFKYRQMLYENLEMLHDIYASSPDAGAKNYVRVTDAAESVCEHLEERAELYSEQYKAGNGLVQLLYTSLVAGALYSVGILVSNTIRFVTVEQETDCQVLYDEIPGTMKHVHIKNILSACNSLETIDKYILTVSKPRARKGVNESISLAAIVSGVMAGGLIITLIPRIVVLIREIIYSIYYTRIKVSDMLGVQADLIRTNIEHLEARDGSQKVIVRQRKIAEKLEKWKNRIAVKMDQVNTLVSVQRKKDAAALHIDRNSALASEPQALSGDDLLL